MRPGLWERSIHQKGEQVEINKKSKSYQKYLFLCHSSPIQCDFSKGRIPKMGKTDNSLTNMFPIFFGSYNTSIYLVGEEEEENLFSAKKVVLSSVGPKEKLSNFFGTPLFFKYSRNIHRKQRLSWRGWEPISLVSQFG